MIILINLLDKELDNSFFCYIVVDKKREQMRFYVHWTKILD